MCKEWEMKNWHREQTPRRWRENAGTEDRECDGRMRYERSGKSGRRMENNSNRQKMMETVHNECSERKVRREKKKKKTMVTTGNLTLDDMDATGK